MKGDFWLWVIWFGCVSGILISKVIEHNRSFFVAFVVVFLSILIYKRYSERRTK